MADNQRALALAQTSYRIGPADLRAVQQQQLSVNAARLSFLRVESEQLAQRVNLHLALGGSFETPASSQEQVVEMTPKQDLAQPSITQSRATQNPAPGNM